MRKIAAAVLITLVLATALGWAPTSLAQTDAEQDAAEFAALPPATRALLDEASTAYAQHHEARGDKAVAALIMAGFNASGFTWSWLHSADPGLLDRRMASIRAILLARRDTMTRAQKRSVSDLICDAGAPCAFGPAKPTEAVRDYVGIPMARALTLIEDEAGPHRLILLGEMHGTREIPVLVGHLVKSYARQGPVVLALEIDANQAGAFAAYLSSDGSAAARAALLADRYWHKPANQSDGRRNLELVDMVEYLRALKVTGNAISILPFDEPPTGKIDTQARDKAMAGRIRAAYETLPSGRLLVLSGNVHAMLARPGYAPPEMQDPMGSYLRDLDPWSVDIAAQSGEFRACTTATCGPSPVSGVFHESGSVADGSYNLRVVLPKFSAARLVDP